MEDGLDVKVVSCFNLSEPMDIVFHGGNDVEMLRIAKDGFYVRGVKLEQDEKEARAIYDALMNWLRGINEQMGVV